MKKPKTYRDWLMFIKQNYDNDINTNLRTQLFDMSNDLLLGWSWSDIMRATSQWEPEELYKISEIELEAIISKIEKKVSGDIFSFKPIDYWGIR